MSESVYTRMREKGIVLPKALAPVGLYLPVQQTGNLVFISGQGCIEDGVHLTGRAGADVTVEEAARRAEICMKNTLAALEGYLGTLERVKKPVKILAFVAGTDDFTQQAVVSTAPPSCCWMCSEMQDATPGRPLEPTAFPWG